MSTGRICALFATMIAVIVVPALIWGARGQRLGKSTAPTGATAAAVVASIICSVGELQGLDLGEKSLRLLPHRGVGLIG